MSNRRWIGVDLDGTLASYDGWRGPDHIGPPIPAMVARVKAWLAAGEDVKLVTARANPRHNNLKVFLDAWIPWSLEHLGAILPITCEKDFHMVELWDDRAIQVEPNTGRPVAGEVSP
jgi:hypothetical protein